MNNNPCCRGFDCEFLSVTKNGKYFFTDCTRPNKEQSLNEKYFEKCSACDILNDCKACTRSSKCPDVH